MRRQHRSFVVTMIVVSLCCGFIGCKYNGSGKRYNPSAYSYYNPFSKFKKDSSFEDDDYGRYAEKDNGIKMPSQGQNPDLSTPPGGYSEDRMAQNANINVPRTGGTNVGGYPQPQNQNTAVAMGTTQSQPSYAPQGQMVPAQYNSNSQYSQNYSNVPQGTMPPASNANYQQSGTNYQQQNTYNNNTQQGTSSYPQGQQYYDQSYQGQGQNNNSASNGYSMGQNYYSDYSNDYHPGSR